MGRPGADAYIYKKSDWIGTLWIFTSLFPSVTVKPGSSCVPRHVLQTQHHKILSMRLYIVIYKLCYIIWIWCWWRSWWQLLNSSVFSLIWVLKFPSCHQQGRWAVKLSWNKIFQVLTTWPSSLQLWVIIVYWNQMKWGQMREVFISLIWD